MGGITFWRLLLTIMMLLILFLIVLLNANNNNNNVFSPSLPPDEKEKEIGLDIGCFWSLAGRSSLFSISKL
jgi:hypothetical protein